MRRIALALLLALAAVGPAAAQAPTTAPAPTVVDLAVEGVALAGPAPRWVEGEPAGVAVVQVTVRNRSPGPVAGYQISYTWDNGQQTPLNGTPQNSIDVVEAPLAAGATHTHPFAWRLQPGQVGSGHVRVLVQAAGGNADSKPLDNNGQLPLFVASHQVRMDSLGQPQQIRPGETVFLRLQVENSGNVAEALTFSLPPPTGSAKHLAATLEETQATLAPNTLRTLTVFATWPEEGEATAFSAQVTVRATATDGRSITAATSTVSGTLSPQDLERFRSALGREGPEVLFAAPDRPAVAEWSARNTGSAADTYAVEVGSLGNGWDVDVTPKVLALDPGAEAKVRVTATPAATLAAGTPALLTTSLVSSRPVPRTEATVALRVSGPAPEIVSAGAAASPFYVGDDGGLWVQVWNRGDVLLPGPSQMQATLQLPDGTELQRALTVPPLEPDQRASLDVPIGRLQASGTVAFSISWQVAAPDGSPAASGEFTVRDPLLSVAAPLALHGLPGQAVAYAAAPHVFWIRNEGEAPEWVALRVTVERGQAILLGPATLLLEPGAQHPVGVRHLLPKAAEGGVDRLLLTASIEARPSLAWSAAIPTRLVDPAAPAIEILARPAQWNLSLELPVEVDVRDDGALSSVLLWVTSPGGGNRTVPLAQGAAGTWGAPVRFSRSGNHTLQVAATDATGNRAVGEPWTLAVRSTAVPRFVLPPVDSDAWIVGRTVNVSVAPAPLGLLSYALRQGGVSVLFGHSPLAGGVASIPLKGALPGAAELELGVDTPEGPATTTLTLHLGEEPPEEEPTRTSSQPPRSKPSPAAVPAFLLALGCALALRRRA